jgi:hypothetical protein
MKDQVALAMQGMRVRFGHQSYPTIYYNDQGLFPKQPDGYYYELPLAPGNFLFFRDGLSPFGPFTACRPVICLGSSWPAGKLSTHEAVGLSPSHGRVSTKCIVMVFGFAVIIVRSKCAGWSENKPATKAQIDDQC